MEVISLVVVGAGIMGRGIAHAAALGGFEVRLVDVDGDVLDRALGTIRSNLDKGVQLGKVRREDAGSARAGSSPPPTCSPLPRTPAWSSRPRLRIWC